MQIAIFGLGKMGAQIARRLHKNQFQVLAWNRSEASRHEFDKFVSATSPYPSPNEGTVPGLPTEALAKAGGREGLLSCSFGDVSDLVSSLNTESRIFWLMLPHGIVDEFLENQLLPHLKAGDIVIDGGNSFYKDSIKRGKDLGKKGVIFYDCGTSGGVWGEKNGFALMVGGPKEHWQVVEPIFKTLSSGSNYGLLGKNGAGHFAKMVHNGIEYGMMEAIGEGYAVLKASEFDYDFNQLTEIYQQGTVIRSWLIDLVKNIFEKEDLKNTKGEINMLGEGEWTVQAGKELGVDVRVLEDSVNVRKESKDPSNQNKFSNKIVALLRKQFGGHGVEKKRS